MSSDAPPTKRRNEEISSLSAKKTSDRETPRTFKGSAHKLFPPKKYLDNTGNGRQEKPCIKTSSLFKNNPEIPELHRCVLRCMCALGVSSLGCRLSFGTLALIHTLSFICRAVVKQAREQVFSPEAFQELNLHPHLVSIPPCSAGCCDLCSYSVCFCSWLPERTQVVSRSLTAAQVAIFTLLSPVIFKKCWLSLPNLVSVLDFIYWAYYCRILPGRCGKTGSRCLCGLGKGAELAVYCQGTCTFLENEGRKGCLNCIFY